MNRKTDIVVVGSGIAGMTAALTAAQSGKKVTLLTHGVGSLAISSGSIDVLGYVDGKAVADPFAAMTELHATHPYRLVGETDVRASLAWLKELCAKAGMTMQAGEGNHQLVTVMGTQKPSYLTPLSFCAEALEDVLRVADTICRNRLTS